MKINLSKKKVGDTVFVCGVGHEFVHSIGERGLSLNDGLYSTSFDGKLLSDKFPSVFNNSQECAEYFANIYMKQARLHTCIFAKETS